MGIVVEYARPTRQAAMEQAEAVRWDYTTFGKSGRPPARARRDVRDDDRQAQRRAQRLQSVAAQWRSLLDGHDEAALHAARGPPLSVEVPQRQRRHPSVAPAPAQLRTGAHRRQADRRRHQGRRDAGRISGARIRLRRRQSGPDAVSLPPAAAHGFRLHGAVQLRPTDRRDHQRDDLRRQPRNYGVVRQAAHRAKPWTE